LDFSVLIQSLAVLLIVILLWVAAWHLRDARLRQAGLLFASYLFYATWGIGFLLVLIASSLMNYVCGLALRRRVTAGRLWTGVILNLLLLSLFKYVPSLLPESPGNSSEFDFMRQIVMPVGISFWTFQGLSYLFDLYREEELNPTLLEFCLYMAFWPTVLSGPVCRLPNMLPQFRRVSGFALDRRVIQGLMMKFVLAQIVGSGFTATDGVTAGFDQVKEGWGGLDVWLLGIGFGFQLFFDFAGYSHIVIGTARIFGIRLEENFDRPYLSLTPSAFWTRWHMSLSFWIRDYVFLPLAAARRERWWPYLALVLAMALFGLWHAAKTTFILWGIYHGLLLVMHRVGQRINRRIVFARPARLAVLLSWASTFLLVSLGWILFRANDLGQALNMYGAVFSPGAYVQLSLPANFYMLIFLVLSGYVLFESIRLLSADWTARYREAMEHNTESVMRLRPAMELIQFVERNKGWCLTPMTLTVLLFGGLIVLAQTSSISPFMYTLF
jgi:alginate O-acetyltransferase complex protein AlgI